MRAPIILAILLGLAALAPAVDSAEAADEIDVSQSADAKALQQGLKDVTMTVLPCLIKASEGGKSDAEAEAYCCCKNRSLVASRLGDLNQLLGKHPEWKGKTLKIVSGAAGDLETHRFGDQQIAEIEASLKKASKSCD